MFILERTFGLFSVVSMFLMSQSLNATNLPLAMAQNNWQEINLQHFSFSVPYGMKPVEAKGIDSAIWKYANKAISLTIELGLYSGKPSVYAKEPDYREEETRIDGRRATICFFRDSEVGSEDQPYVAALYFSNVDGKATKLSFFVVSNSPKGQEIAKRIFLSVKFNKSKRK